MWKKIPKFGWEFLAPLILYGAMSVVESLEGDDFPGIVSFLPQSQRAAFLRDFPVIFVTLLVVFLVVEFCFAIVLGPRVENALTTPPWMRLAHAAFEAVGLALSFALAVFGNEAVTLVRNELHAAQWPEPQTRLALLLALGLVVFIYLLLVRKARVGRWFGIHGHQKLLVDLDNAYDHALHSDLMGTRQATLTAYERSAGNAGVSRYEDRELPFDPGLAGRNQNIWLSEPGGGKTAQLYRTGSRLVKKAPASLKPPVSSADISGAANASVIYVPFVLDLSTWAVQNYEDFEQWLIFAIVNTYNVFKGTANQLVTEFGAVRALPLLDSLDVMYEQKGAACLKAIETYLAKTDREQGKTVPLIICCRVEIFKRLKKDLGASVWETGGSHLASFQQLEIQPLDEQAIVQALDVRHVDFLAPDVKTNPRWRELLKTPLHLSLLFLTAGQNDLDDAEKDQLRAIVDDPDPQAQPNAMRERLIDTYVARQYPDYTPRIQNIKKALAWIAHLLVQAAARPPSLLDAGTAPDTALGEAVGTTLYLEGLQPDCLPAGDASQRAYSRIMFMLRNAFRLLTALVFGVGIAAAVTMVTHLDQGTVASLLFGRSQNELGAPVVLGAFGLVSGLGVGYSLGSQISATSPIKLVDRIQYDQHQSWIAWLIGGGVTVILALVIWLSLASGTSLTARTIEASVLGLDGGAFTAVIIDLLARLRRSRAIEVSRDPLWYHWPGQGVSRSVYAATRILALYTMAGVLFGGVAIGLIIGVLAGFGIHTLRDAVILALAGALSGAVMGALGAATFIGINEALNKGGAAALQHIALRMALRRSQALPQRLTRLLEDANRIGLVSRVGGGYRFVVGLLQDDFARQYQSLILDEIEKKRLAASERKRRSLMMKLTRMLKRNPWGRHNRRAPNEATHHSDDTSRSLMPEPDAE